MKKVVILIFMLFFFMGEPYAYQSEKLDLETTNNLELTDENILLQDIKFENGNFSWKMINNNLEQKKIEYILNLYGETDELIYSLKTDYRIKGNQEHSGNFFDVERTLSNKGKSLASVKYYNFEINVTRAMDSLQYNNRPDYIINDYDINILVSEENKYEITETIYVTFNKEKHGIYRKLPLENEVIRPDGTTEINKAKISKIEVNEKYSLSTDDSLYKIIKIGDSDTLIFGKKKYIIKYNYNIGNDQTSNYDEFYFNIIGTEWNSYITNTTFTITMPKEFDASKLSFGSGKAIITETNGISYNVNKNVISGQIHDTLSPYQGLTIRLELPEGYYQKQVFGFDYDLIDLSILLIPISMVLVSYLLWRKFGKEEELVETIEFYPPNQLNSLEIGYIYNENNSKMVASLIVYLANKGYLKIVDTSIETGKKNSFKLIKLKEYDGTDENERAFLTGLFLKDIEKYTMDIKSWNEVTLNDLKKHFHGIKKLIEANVRIGKLAQSLHKKDTKIPKTIANLLAFICTLIAAFYPYIVLNHENYLFVGISTALLYYLCLLGCSFLVSLYIKCIKSKGSEKAYNIIVALLISIIAIPYMLTYFLESETVLENIISAMNDFKILAMTCASIISAIACQTFAYHMRKRSEEGQKLYARVRGFKDFLEKVEKDKLEELVYLNPNYFYDILPYAYVLDVTSVWMKKFESITIQTPSWYVGNSFNINSFNSFMNSSVMTTNKYNSVGSRGGRGFGGGRSGGGSGGGGGGSW